MISPSGASQNTPMASIPNPAIPPPYQPIMVNFSISCPFAPASVVGDRKNDNATLFQ
jgi:hypothetical protein